MLYKVAGIWAGPCKPIAERIRSWLSGEADAIHSYMLTSRTSGAHLGDLSRYISP